MSTDPAHGGASTAGQSHRAGAQGLEQAAALVAVLLLTSAEEPSAAGGEPTSGGHWSARDRLVRPPLTPGPDAWRGSGLPR